MFDLESDNERHTENVSIAELILLQPNEPDSLADHFAKLNTRLNSTDVWMMSYGEQFGASDGNEPRENDSIFLYYLFPYL